ncbi:hypothetical protein J6590_066502, partial [Homalodisca vitripennis]
MSSQQWNHSLASLFSSRVNESSSISPAAVHFGNAAPPISGWMRLSGGLFGPRPQRTSLLDSRSIGRNFV